MTLTIHSGNVSETPVVLHVAFELSNSFWKVGFSDGKKLRVAQVPARDLMTLESKIEWAKAKFQLSDSVRVVSCYEAGRDGFWLHRYLTRRGIENVVIEPASVQVDRRARRENVRG